MTAKWPTPLLKQCFATLGVSLNYMTHGLVLGFTPGLISALKKSTEILVDDSSVSWIVSIFGISFIFGAITVPSIMHKFGRKPAHALSAVFMTTGWVTIALSTTVATILIGRLLQGFSMGLLASLGAVLVGEYSSPKNRGALLATISTFILIGTWISHSFETYVTWKLLALIFAAVSVLDLLIIFLSPESPSFLVNKGRYKESRKAHIWLRGNGADEDIEKLIKTHIMASKKCVNDERQKGSGFARISNGFLHVKTMLSKKEVYKPIIITMHLYTMNAWAGAITYDTYAHDVLDTVVGKDVSFAVVASFVDLDRLLSSMVAIIFVTKLRRKLILVISSLATIMTQLSIISYVYLKTHSSLVFDHPLIGIVLLHIHLSCQSLGIVMLSNIIPGEIFPIEHRGSCGMVAILTFSINEIINLKSVLFLFSSLGLHGAYMVYVIIVTYCFVIIWWMLPETKDRTLLDIEEEFRNEPLYKDDSLLDTNEDYENDRKVKSSDSC